MKNSRFAMVAALAAGLAAAAPAQAGGKGRGEHKRSDDAPIPVCTLADLAPGAEACSGFFKGNLLSDSPSDVAAQAGALSRLGLGGWDGGIVEPQLDLSGETVNFATLLNGVTYVGVHWGAGEGSPSPHTPGGVTAFYRFDAGAALDDFTLAYGSASGARLYYTEPIQRGFSDSVGQAVPEPAAWALMILGFGAVGGVLRRKRAVAAA